MSDLQQAIRDQLKASQDQEDSKKQLLTSELLPIDNTLVDMASDKVRSLTNLAIKKATEKGSDLIKQKTGIDLLAKKQDFDLIKQKTGIDLLAKKQELTDNARNILNNMNDRANNLANDLLGQAQDRVENTLSQGREGIHNLLNSFSSLKDNIPEMPHVQPSLEADEDVGNLLERPGNILNNMNVRANELMGQAQNSFENTLSQGREGIHNMLNSFSSLRNNIPEIPRIQPSLAAEEDVGNLLERPSNILNNMNVRANELMGQAQNSFENTLSQGREGIHNMLNSFSSLRNNIPEIPRIQPSLAAVEDVGNLLERL